MVSEIIWSFPPNSSKISPRIIFRELNGGGQTLSIWVIHTRILQSVISAIYETLWSSMMHRNVSFCHLNVALLLSTALVLNSFLEAINSFSVKNDQCVYWRLKRWLIHNVKEQTFVWSMSLEKPEFPKMAAFLNTKLSTGAECMIVRFRKNNFH